MPKQASRPRAITMSNTDQNFFKLTEIEVVYNPEIKPSERMKITSSSDAEKVLHSIPMLHPIKIKGE